MNDGKDHAAPYQDNSGDNAYKEDITTCQRKFRHREMRTQKKVRCVIYSLRCLETTRVTVSPSIMTNPKDSCTETTPISVSSDDSRNKEEGDKINEDMGQRSPKRGVDSTLGLPPSENRESVSGDIPRPQQSEPLEAVKEKSITLKQEEPSTEPSQGTDNGDDEDVIRLNEALSRLDVKDEDGPEGLSGCSSRSEILTRVPETTSLGSSVDPESDECGDKGSERLSESSLESDGNVSDDESDIDSDGISSMSDSSLPQDSREQLVARGPTRRQASQPRHQGKPYDRQPASPYVVTREQNDDLMELVRGSSDGKALSQHSSPQGPLDQTYVDAWQDDIVGNDQSQNASGIFEIAIQINLTLKTLKTYSPP
ncbi:uncharacterized protein LOC124289817 isoform X2 [Haliotis rubra]|uniref:uncharacterized protein LOC124289817 isoform X2 n=1 Tax=Haliotis rubra TaxID=36100 RepID=UPI001EE4FD3D|nr:uncharacterized protein LOC124289817 isoform X2 [Haliotis rubra]